MSTYSFTRDFDLHRKTAVFLFSSTKYLHMQQMLSGNGQQKSLYHLQCLKTFINTQCIGIKSCPPKRIQIPEIRGHISILYNCSPLQYQTAKHSMAKFPFCIIKFPHHSTQPQYTATHTVATSLQLLDASRLIPIAFRKHGLLYYSQLGCYSLSLSKEEIT